MTGTEIAVSLVAGLFGGAGWNAAWEFWFRPRRDRGSIARALTSEIEGNLLVAENMLFDGGVPAIRVPSVAAFSTLVFTSLAPRLGDVDLDALQNLIWLYRDFDHLNRLSEVILEARKTGIEPMREAAERDIANAFDGTLKQMMVASILVREGLSKAATGTKSRRQPPAGIHVEGDLDGTHVVY